VIVDNAHRWSHVNVVVENVATVQKVCQWLSSSGSQWRMGRTRKQVVSSGNERSVVEYWIEQPQTAALFRLTWG
jgi:hypothetical protein